MIQKLKIFDETLDQLNKINNENFLYDNFCKVNSDLDAILAELIYEEKNLKKIKHNKNYLDIFNSILNKIDKLETKILPKAYLLDSFKSFNR